MSSARGVNMVLRVQSRSGNWRLSALTPHSSLRTLQELLADRTGIETDRQKILCGYPPRELPSYLPIASLDELGVKSGETVIVERNQERRERLSLSDSDCVVTGVERSSEPSCAGPPLVGVAGRHKGGVSATPGSSSGTHAGVPRSKGVGREVLTSSSSPASSPNCFSDSDFAASTMGHFLSRGERLQRWTVPADNSCLFRSVCILLNGESPYGLRELAASIILSNPTKYDRALLGKGNQQYVAWILREDTWGGAIELSIFSEHFKTELDVVDVQTQRIDRFGEDRGYRQRALLIYDGIHYDPLVVTSGNHILQKVFPTSDDGALAAALEMAGAAHQAHRYTDLHNFKMRCLVCGSGLTSQEAAAAHAQTTGHCNFSQV